MTEITARPSAKPKRPKKAKMVKEAVESVSVQPVLGYRGFIALALDSGQITSINVQAVHRNDRFDYAYGLNERLEHVPAAGDRGDITHFYAYARFRDGGHCFDVLSRAEVDAVRDRSESYQAYREGRAKDSPWVTGYAEMGKEIAIRRIIPYLPPAVQEAAALADVHEPVQSAVLDEPGEIMAGAPEPVDAPAEQPALQAPEAIDLTEEELAGLFPPGYVMRILDAAAECDMPDEVLAEIVGVPFDEIPPEDESAVLRAIASWQR